MKLARLTYPLLALWGAAALAITPEDVQTRISDAKFETATTVLFEAKDGSQKQREVFLWVYQTRLGQILNSRAPNAAETAELKRICKQMHRLASKSKVGAFDAYGIELANGRGDTSRLPSSKRAVFFFWDEGRCATPSKGQIQ
ncbi:hypothetical protein [Roseovarius phycicola]|uniref:Uncharacterized protein n=1 Tax=Roseovarius phycicola TaxID=3080976 RepID=A0ABZ2HMW5_9RHOB